jgi:hypothetical protein
MSNHVVPAPKWTLARVDGGKNHKEGRGDTSLQRSAYNDLRS